LSEFNITTTGVGVAVPSVMMFASGFYIGKHAECYVGGLSI